MTSPLHPSSLLAATVDTPDLTDFDDLVSAAAGIGDDARAAITLAARWGRELPPPGDGGTAVRMGVLRAVARRNLTAARVLEAHADALAVLGEAGNSPEADRSWGVFAAEAPGVLLEARPDGDGGFRLDGTKPWCSLAGHLDRALVTAHEPDGRRLFEVDLHHPGVRPEESTVWAARGLRSVTSAPVHFDDVPARPVGPVGWYLTRPGFAWGGIGVAACWLGGVDGLVDTLRVASVHRDGELSALHVGIVDTAHYAADRVLADAVERIASGRAFRHDGVVLALRVRSVVAEAVEQVVRQVGHALGPGPLAFDADHAARVADLALYVRQHHAERDLATLGRSLLDEASP